MKSTILFLAITIAVLQNVIFAVPPPKDGEVLEIFDLQKYKLARMNGKLPFGFDPLDTYDEDVHDAAEKPEPVKKTSIRDEIESLNNDIAALMLRVEKEKWKAIRSEDELNGDIDRLHRHVKATTKMRSSVIPDALPYRNLQYRAGQGRHRVPSFGGLRVGQRNAGFQGRPLRAVY